jgi:hypothetical protein
LVHILYFSVFYLSSVLEVISAGLNILFRKYVTHIHLYFLTFSSPPVSDLPLAWPVFHNIVNICIVSVFHIWQKICSLCLFESYPLHKWWSHFRSSWMTAWWYLFCFSLTTWQFFSDALVSLTSVKHNFLMFELLWDFCLFSQFFAYVFLSLCESPN